MPLGTPIEPDCLLYITAAGVQTVRGMQGKLVGVR